MSMSTQIPTGHSVKMTSPDLRFRTSTTMWGPLQLTLINHREGAERGYEAGQAAYCEESDYALEDAMARYLAAPRYRPRICTPTIIQEWRAMFLLGWTSQLLERPMPAHETYDQAKPRLQHETGQPTLTESAFVTQGRGQR